MARAQTHDTKRLYRNPKNGFWYWKPEAKLRPHWRMASLGQAMEPAKAEARRLNRLAETWLAKAPAQRRGPPPARRQPVTVAALISLYKVSADWRALAASTQGQYGYELGRLEDEFGHEVAATLDETRVDDWADDLRETAPETLRHVAARGRTIFTWGARKTHVPRGVNPFKGIKAGNGKKRRFRFTWPDVMHILAVAIEEKVPSVAVALAISFATVQRITDVIEFDDSIVVSVKQKARLRFVQGKTGVEIDMTMPEIVVDLLLRHPPIETAKARTTRPWIVSETTREPYHEKTVSRVFARVLEAAIAKEPVAWAHLKGGQLRDGRRSGFVHRIEAGATVPQVCAISGHSLDEGFKIVEHYLPRTPELADQAEQFLKVSL